MDPSQTQPTAVTGLLERARLGDEAALAHLMPLVYDELRVMARRQIRRGGRDATINTTALVHEAFVKLSEANEPNWNDRCHFMAVAATAMRHILIDHARRRTAHKRGQGAPHVSLDDLTFEDGGIPVETQAELLIAIDSALVELAHLSPRLARVVELRFFGGMTDQESAAILAVDPRTVRRDWVKARAWLHQALSA